MSRARCHLSLTKWECNEHPVVACHVVIIPAQKRYSSRLYEQSERTGAACRWEALRDMTIAAAFRVPRDILGNPVPRCCLPACAEVRSRFGRLIIFLHPLWTDYVRQAWQAAQITAYFFLYPFVLSFRRAPSGERCDAPLCNGRNLHDASVRLPSLFFRPDGAAALINRAAQTSGSHHSVHAPCGVVCSFAFTVAAASFLNPVTVRK